MKKVNYKMVLMVTIISANIFAGCEEEKFINEEGSLVPKTVDQDPALPSIIVNGAQLHAEAFGPVEGSLIIVLHGGPGSDYRSLLRCKEFANYGFRVVFYDQRGAGLSERFPESVYSMQIMFDDLEAVINHYRVSPGQNVILLGQSWGAMLATAYVNEHPDAISGLILGEPGGLVWQDVVDYVDRSRDAKITSEIMNDMLYMDQFITGKSTQQEILDYKYGLLSFNENEEGNPIGNEQMVPFWRGGAVTNKAFFDIGEAEKPDWTTNLQLFPTDILFMYSENNKAYGPDHAAKVSSAYPDVQLLEVKGAGHDMLTFETGWNNAFPVILEYLNSHK